MEKTVQRFLTGALLAFLLLCGVSRAQAADTLVFTSSDFPELNRGFVAPADGPYSVVVWADGRLDWTVKAEGQAITLTPRAIAGKPGPAWLELADLPLKAGPATLVVEPMDGRAPVPALISLSTDREYRATRMLDLIRGNAASTGPTLDLRRSKIRTNQEGADFEPPDSTQAWRDRSKAVREHLLVTLGLWPMPPKTELSPRVVGSIEREGYVIDKVVLETFPGFTLAGNLYRPTNRAGRLPVVMCPHGHWDEGRVNEDVQSRCVRLAQLGCVVYLYDMVGFCDNKPFGHAFLDDRLRRWGLSLPTLQTWNSIRALDYLTSRPDVDPARVAITGESGGATQTLLLTAIDDRIKVSAPVVMVSDGFQGGCACENAAGLRLGTDNVEFAAMTAPRPLKMVGATGDWTSRLMTNAFPNILLVYGRVGATDRVSADVFDFPHNYNQTSRNAVYAFLGKWLLGVDDPASTREGKLTVEDREALKVYTEQTPYPEEARTAEQLEAELVGVLARQVDKLGPTTVASNWEAGRDRLLTALKVRVGVESPAPRETTAREVRRVARDGLAIVHSVVGRKAKGELIPVVRLTPVRPSGRLTVLFTGRGKADLALPDGEPSPLVRALLDRGQSVVGFDPLLIGESHDPQVPATRRPSANFFDTYNKSLAADRAQDLATVLSWARAMPDVLEVNLVATGKAGPLAMLARPALANLGRTAVDLDGFGYGDGSIAVPIGLDLPGVLQFGGLNAAAALSAPAPLWIIRPGPAFDAAWPTRSYALADAPGQLRIDPEVVDPAAIARWIDSGD